jgi:DNA polymerase-1
MLTGQITYIKNNRLFKYEVDATDTSETFSMYMTSGNYDAIMLLSNPEAQEDPDALWERSVEVKLTKINVLTKILNQEINGKIKKVKAQVNSDFFCRLGAIIRYVKINCSTVNEEGYTGMQLASGEFQVHAEKNYIVPFPMNPDKTLARVTLKYGDISNLWIQTDDFTIDLRNETMKEPRVFYKPKDAWTSGFKLDSEYLGFELKPQIISEHKSSDGMYHSIEEIIAAHPDKEFSWLLKKDYRIVTDETIDEVCKYIMDWDGYVYYDTETTGLNINFMSRTGQADQLVGVVLSVKYGESFYFPLQMKAIKNLCGGDHFYVMEHYLRPILEGKDLVAHNMEYDWKVGYIYGINCNIVHDTMAILELTLAAEYKDYKVGLKENAKLLLGRDSLELSDLIVDDSWGESDIRFWDLPEELVRLYACADTDNTNGLLGYALQNDLLGKYNARKVYEIEIAFSYAVAYQEFYGHRIDINKLDEMREEIGKGQDEEMAKMVEIVGHEFNPNSPPQLVKIIYGELGIPEQISRKTGRPTTDKETLKKLAELTDAEDNIMYPFVGHLQKYREYEGVRKIIDKFPEHVTGDGYVFSHVMQYGTTTGRVSINTPNYQSYNDPIKKNVIPRPGFWMFDTDYSSVEYRVLGNMVGNKRIMESFKDPDFDYHQYQAARMYGVPYSTVTKKMRKAAKGINFGLPYGMGDESLGIRVFGEESPENTRKAAALRAAYFKGQEDIRDWFEHHRNHGVNEGYTATYFGRRRYYRRSDFSVSAIRRQAGNQVIQGTAADIYKTAVGRVFKRICREGWLGKVMFTGFIHDELLGEVSNDINPGVFLKALREEFEVKITNEDGTPWSPLYMGFGYGMSWYEAKSVELPIKLQWEIVDKYGETGFPEWDGNGRKFCDTIPDKLRDFEVRDIRNQLLDPDSQGKEIKPTLNNQVLAMCKDDAEIYPEAISDYMQIDYLEAQEMGCQQYLSTYESQICKYLDEKYHIQGLYKNEDGTFPEDFKFKPAKTTQEAITQYCMLHGVDRSKVNVLDIEEYKGSGNVADATSIISDYSDEDDSEATSEEKLQRIKDTRIDTLGLYMDTSKMEITLMALPSNYMTFIQQRVNREEKGYRVWFKDSLGILNAEKKGALYLTQSWLDSGEIQTIQQLYLQFFKTQK